MIKKISNLKRACPAKLERGEMRSGGFTVLESIVAIAVLSLSISGVFSAVTQSLSQATIAKDEVKAFYLAGEAIEIIKNKRDANQLYKIKNPLSLNTWLTGIAQDASDPCYFNKICRVSAKSYDPTDPANPNFFDCASDPGGVCLVLKQDNTYLYVYTMGNDTNFKREIKIELVQIDSFGNPVEIAITVKISWTKGIITREFKIKEHLFNWI